MEIFIEKKYYEGSKRHELHLYINFSSKQEKQDFNEILGHCLYDNPVETFSSICREFFGDHGTLYEELGIDTSTLYDSGHPEDNDFNGYCTGFRDFIEKADENTLTALAQLITNKIAQKIQRWREYKNIYISGKAVVTFPSQQSNISIPALDLSFLNKAVIIQGDKAFTVQLIPLDNVKSINDLQKEVVNTVKRTFEMQLRARIKALQKRIEILQRQLEQERANAFLNGLQLASELSKKGWIVENGWLVYKHTIYVKAAKYQGNIYPVKSKEFFVQGLKIKIKNTINNDDVVAEKSNHPNIKFSENSCVCLGELQGKTLLEVLNNIVQTLSVANLDSAYRNEATARLKQYIRNREWEKAETQETETSESQEPYIWTAD